MSPARVTLAAILMFCLLTPARGSGPCGAVSCGLDEFCFRGSCVAVMIQGRSSRPHPHHSGGPGQVTAGAGAGAVLLSAAVLLVHDCIRRVV